MTGGAPPRPLVVDKGVVHIEIFDLVSIANLQPLSEFSELALPRVTSYMKGTGLSSKGKRINMFSVEVNY